MLEGLLKSFQLVDKTVKKENVLKTYNSIISIVQEDVLPVLKELTAVERSSRITKSKILDLLKDLVRTKKSGSANNAKDFIKNLNKLFKDVVGSTSDVEELIIKHASATITDRVMSAKDAAIIKLVDDISSMSLYAMDLVTCILSDVNETSFPKIKFKKLKEDMPGFVELYLHYFDGLDKAIEEISTMDNTTISKKSPIAMLTALFSNSKTKLPVATSKGFINNPFYHIRMWLVDRDMAKLDVLKDKKRLIELRIMELKLELRSSDADPDLEKRIEYFEEKLSSLEYDIQKLES